MYLNSVSIYYKLRKCFFFLIIKLTWLITINYIYIILYKQYKKLSTIKIKKINFYMDFEDIVYMELVKSYYDSNNKQWFV